MWFKLQLTAFSPNKTCPAGFSNMPASIGKPIKNDRVSTNMWKRDFNIKFNQLGPQLKYLWKRPDMLQGFSMTSCLGTRTKNAQYMGILRGQILRTGRHKQDKTYSGSDILSRDVRYSSISYLGSNSWGRSRPHVCNNNSIHDLKK